jgi:hypothetical protein
MYVKWNFKNVTAAYANQSLMMSEWYRPKIKFAAGLHNRVIVQRKLGPWDLTVSRTDPAGFVDAIWKVTRDHDDFVGVKLMSPRGENSMFGNEKGDPISDMNISRLCFHF